MALKIGIAEKDWTPAIGIPLMGNFRDDYASKGVHDPLMAKAIVFEDSANTKVALLTVDICMINRKHIALMRTISASKPIYLRKIF